MQLRTVTHAVVALLNPGGAPASLTGISRLSDRTLHREAAALLGDRRLTVVAGSRDVGQLVPFRAGSLLRLVEGERVDQPVPSVPRPKPAPAIDMSRLEYWQAVWAGSARDAEARQIIVWTAAAALLTVRPEIADMAEARQAAEELWRTRQRSGSAGSSREGRSGGSES